MQLPAPLRGPHPPLPRPLDAAAEAWAALQPRVRTLVVVMLAAALATGVSARVTAAEHRWGGRPRLVLTATKDLEVGADAIGAVRAVRLPPDAVPPGAVGSVPEGAVLALALPAGSVLTTAHLDARGPAAGLSEGLRAVPLDIEPGWGVAAGGWVDVWVLGAGPEPSTLVARSRPVLQVRAEDASATALVGLDEHEVAVVTGGMTLGGVLLTHAPPPRGGGPSG